LDGVALVESLKKTFFSETSSLKVFLVGGRKMEWSWWKIHALKDPPST
jgi:hypothetical protein